ncbi:MAG TPA: sulfatase-like hydrolase/transferase [Phycisphaerae bacterium]|nr:sulfatase-like hydrolase/transferase [Phycisphaerae bacterium]HOI56320.1 sulfatase-like hydrolase/transferase [Phycisphaerae bacterium]
MARPNILYVITDQQRWDTLACYGNRQVFTPHLDRLAAEGTVFDRCYTSSPECVPARSVMMTGLPPHRTGCFSNGHAYSTEAPTFLRLLREAGYLTQCIGKMHFKPAREGFGAERLCLSEEIPGTVAEDEFLTDLHAAGFQWAEEPHGMRSHMYYVPQVSQLPDRLHTTTWTGDRTVRFIEEQAAGERPWLCWTGFIKPHPPFDPTVPFNTLYDPVEMPLPVRGPECKESRNFWQHLQNVGKWMDRDPDEHLCQAQKAHYWATISQVDVQVGRILAALERTGQADNTLVVFNSDHGEFLGDHHCWGKRSWYEGPGHVPLLVRWAGGVPRGQRRSQLVSHEDILPTFLAAAGVAAPRACRGANLLDVAARAAATTRDVFVGQFAEKGHALYAAIDGRWKYIFSAQDRKEQLFDHDDDPQELRNRAGDPAAAADKARLKRAAIEYFRRDGYDDPIDGQDWRQYSPSQCEMERVLQIGKTCHGVVAGYRQYATWNGRAKNVFRPEGRVS